MWISIPCLHWDGRPKDLTSTLSLKHWCAAPPPGLSLVSLVLYASPLKCSLKLLQGALLNAAQRSFSLFEIGVPHLLSADLVSCRQTHDQRTQLVTPGSESGINLLALLVSFLIIPCNWKDRGEHYLCSWSLNQLSQSPEVSLDHPKTSCCNFVTAYLKNQ